MTYEPQVRRTHGLQPLCRASMSSICDVCGRVRFKGNHDRCSKARQAAGFIIVEKRV